MAVHATYGSIIGSSLTPQFHDLAVTRGGTGFSRSNSLTKRYFLDQQLKDVAVT